jgi:hypothetical protein
MNPWNYCTNVPIYQCTSVPRFSLYITNALPIAFRGSLLQSRCKLRTLILLRAATGIGHVMIGSTAYRVLYLGVMSD